MKHVVQILCAVAAGIAIFIAGRASADGYLRGTDMDPTPFQIGEPDHDPKPGTDFHSAIDARRIDGKKGTYRNALVVFVGECTGCFIEGAKASRLPYDRFDEVLIVFRAPKAQAGLSSPEFPRARIVADEDGRLSVLLNPRWIPRWYVLNNGKLLKAQEKPQDDNWN